MPDDAVFAELARRVADRYRGASVTAVEFARGKLLGDPVYADVLYSGLLPSGGTVVDIGCGQGLMLALLIEARERVRASAWPATQPQPPLFDRLVGVETRPRMAQLARSALGGKAEIVQADARTVELENYSAVLLFDVLHMMSRKEQERLLSRIAATLRSEGVVLVREADASAGWRFALVRLGNRLKALTLGSRSQRFFYRSREEWLACFAGLGLRVEPAPTRRANALGNVLFRVSRRATGPSGSPPAPPCAPLP